MIDHIKQLEEKWHNIHRHECPDGGYRLVESKSPLEWYAGYASTGQKALMAVSTAEPRNFQPSKSITALKRKRQDSRWTFSLLLEENEQDSVFVDLCADLIDYTSTATSEEDALQLLNRRYRQWSRLLASGKTTMLSDTACKGLIGELYLFSQFIEKGLPPIRVLNAWCGPDGQDQDFVFDHAWYEVKSTESSSTQISISSLQQLARTDPGYLVVITVEKCTPEQPGGISLGELVTNTRALLGNNTEATELFEDKLIGYGYLDQTKYLEQRYLVLGKTAYLVDDNFPKLSPSNVPSQITNVQYLIDLISIADWRTEDNL